MFYTYNIKLQHAMDNISTKIRSRSLEFVLNHFSLSGKAWLTVLLFLRVLSLIFLGSKLWNDKDDRLSFSCDTNSRKCDDMCYEGFEKIYKKNSCRPDLKICHSVQTFLFITSSFQYKVLIL